MDENQHRHHSNGSTPAKHFMLSTISASSKANPPTKKILAERNDFQDTHLQKIEIFDSKNSKSQDSRTNWSTESEENQENTLIADLLSKSSDPLSNCYLYPRPKFLRYKPNRRREMFSEEGKNCLLEPKKDTELDSSCASLASDFKEVKVDQEHEEIDDSDEEFDEFEEERGSWGLWGVVKFVFLMGVLVFSTLYISSMNSAEPYCVVQAVQGVKDGFQKIHDHVFGYVKKVDNEKFFFFNSSGIELVRFGDIDGIKKEEMIKHSEIEGGGKEEEEEEVDDELDEVVAEMQTGGEATEIVAHEDKEIVDDGLVKVVEVQSGDVSDVNDLKIAKAEDFVPDIGEADTEEFLDQVKTNSVFHEQEPQEVIITEAVDNEKELFHSEISYERLTKNSEVELITGFCVLPFIASLVLALHFKKKRNARKGLRTIAKPCFDSVKPDKWPAVDREQKHTEHPVSVLKPKSLTNPSEEYFEQPLHKTGAPSVELLSELVVGEASSSLRSVSAKKTVIESEVSSHSVPLCSASSVPIHQRSALSEISTMNFDSYNDENKVLNEDGVSSRSLPCSAKTTVAASTPLRRSSRLRNRAVSP